MGTVNCWQCIEFGELYWCQVESRCRQPDRCRRLTLTRCTDHTNPPFSFVLSCLSSHPYNQLTRQPCPFALGDRMSHNLFNPCRSTIIEGFPSPVSTPVSDSDEVYHPTLLSPVRRPHPPSTLSPVYMTNLPS